MSELKSFIVLYDGHFIRVYEESEADKVIADLEESHKMEVEQLLIEIAALKNRIAPKQSDKTLQERLNEVCKKHAVSTLQDLDWSFCMAEARLEDYTKLASDKHEALEKMLQYKVLYKEMCRDINTQERFFAMKVAHANYKRCLAMAKWCEEAYNRECGLNPEEMTNKEFYKQQTEFWPRWNSKWIKIAEQFKEAK